MSLVSSRPVTPPRERPGPVDGIRSRVHAPSDVRGLAALLLTFVGARLLVSLVGFAGYVLAPSNPAIATVASFPEYPLLDGWTRGDGLSYLVASHPRLWLDTFGASGGAMPLPVLPSVIAAAEALHVSPLFSSIVVVNLALLLAVFALDRLVTPRFGRGITTRAALLLLIFPFGFQLAVTAPFSLVLLCGLVAFLGIESDRPWVTALAGMLGSLAHPLGLAIWPASAVALLTRPQADRGRWRRAFDYLSLAVVPAAVTAYAAYLHRADQLPFPRITQTVLGRPGFPLANAVGTGDSRSVGFIVAFNVVAAVLVAASTPGVATRIGRPHAVYLASLLILPVLVNPSGLGTAAALGFPAFIWLAVVLEGRELAEGLWISGSGLGLGLAVAAYVQSYPIAGALAVAPLTGAQPVLASFHARLLLDEPQTQYLPRDLYATVDNTLLFLGYRPLQDRYEPGQSVPISLYFYAQQTPADGYLISARLHDRQGQERARFDKTLWGSADAVLFSSTSNRSLVQSRYYQENFDLPIGSTVPPGDYVLDVQLFRIPSFALVPVVQGDHGPSDHLLETPVIVAGAGDFAASGGLRPSHSSEAVLDDGINFQGFDAVPGGLDRTLGVALYWQARARPTRDYTVFVQALDDQGKLVAQSDSYPWSGGLPTSTWQAGWTIRDVHELSLPTSWVSGKVHLIAGMYRLDTLRRLSVRPPNPPSTPNHLDPRELVVP